MLVLGAVNGCGVENWVCSMMGKERFGAGQVMGNLLYAMLRNWNFILKAISS